MLLDGRPRSHPLLVDAATGAITTVGDVLELSAQFQLDRRPLTFLIPDRSVRSYCAALALIEAGAAVALIDGGVGRDAVMALLERYRPGRVIDPGGILALDTALGAGSEVHADLAVLLTTSGTTGSPHLVRLSAGNIVANARQISEALALQPSDRAVTTMPLTYSFGLSVLTSHAVSGGSLVVSSRSVIEAEFWDEIQRFGVTSLAGVPATYAMLKRLRRPEQGSPLRLLLQAGGRLDPELVRHFHAVMTAAGGRFMVMYGQTEAGPRMTVLPSADVPARSESVGLALPGGAVRILDPEGEPLGAGLNGRVIYTGPNVMMGYADQAADLLGGDSFGDSLDTGDEGYVDEGGYLFLTGRSKRICKLNGMRVSLDEVESLAAGMARGEAEFAAVSAREDELTLAVAGLPETCCSLQTALASRLRVPTRYIGICAVPTIPRLPNGKTDYQALRRELIS